MSTTEERRDSDGTSGKVFSPTERNVSSLGLVWCLCDGVVVHRGLQSLPKWERKMVRKLQKDWRECGVLEVDEEIDGVYEEIGLGDTMAELEEIGHEGDDKIVHVHSKELYSVLESFQATETLVETKYKTVAKKVKPVSIPLLEDSKEQIERVSKEKSIRDSRKAGHTFMEKTLDEMKIRTDDTLFPIEKVRFREMLRRHGKAFAFEPHEIGCVDPSVVPPMIIFTVPHAVGRISTLR